MSASKPAPSRPAPTRSQPKAPATNQPVAKVRVIADAAAPRTLQAVLAQWETDQPKECRTQAAALVSRVLSQAQAGSRRIECDYDGLAPNLMDDFRIDVISVGTGRDDEQAPCVPLAAPPEQATSSAGGVSGLDWLGTFTRMGFPIIDYVELEDAMELVGQTAHIDDGIRRMLTDLDHEAKASYRWHEREGIRCAKQLFECKVNLRLLAKQWGSASESDRPDLAQKIAQAETARQDAQHNLNKSVKQAWGQPGDSLTMRQTFGGVLEIECVTGTYSTQTNTVYSFTPAAALALASKLGCLLEELWNSLGQMDQRAVVRLITHSQVDYTVRSNTYYESLDSD